MIALDTSAVIAIFNEEAEAPQIAERLVESSGLCISSATLVELRIVAMNKWPYDGADMTNDLFDRMKVDIVAFTADHPLVAAEGYRRYGRGTGSRARLNFGDCFSYALAKSRDLPLLFVGEDFTHTDVRSALSPL